MTGAMYAAISGLKSHMNKLNVIGNNIANVNTYGYKAGRMVFQEAMYTTMTGGSNGTPLVGGRNPSQIGYGAQIGSIDLDMSSGSFSPTGRPTDCMIDGDGFFMVGDKDVFIDPDDAESLKALNLTRVGNFEFKADGYLSDGAGNVVYGFLCTGTREVTDPDTGAVTSVPVYSDKLVPIRLPKYGPVNPDGTPGDATDADAKMGIQYPQDGADGLVDGPGKIAGMDSITIDQKTGKITGISKDTGNVVNIGYIAMANVTNPNGVTHMGGPYYKAGDGAGDMAVSLMGGAGASLMDKDGNVLDHVNGSKLDGMRIGSAGTTSLVTGGLEMSKTDLATEISEMITTQRGYQANTRIITVTDAMLEELVNIKR